MDAHEIVGPLNKAEVCNALLDYDIERSKFQTWNLIEVMVLESSDEVKKVLYESGQAKRIVEEQQHNAAVKHRREARKFDRNVCH